MKSIITIITVLLSFTVVAQTELCKQDWTPLCDNNLPTKFFYLKTEGPFQYNINSKSKLNEIGNGSAEISGNRTSTIRLKFPVLNKPRAVITGGVRYTDEQFYFNHTSPEKYPLYVSLDDRNLKSLGGDLKGMFHLRDNRSLVVQSSLYLAGDFYRDDKRYFSASDLLKGSLAIGYGIKKDANTYKAYGVYFGYTFGRPSFYPVFNYIKRYNNGWGLDLILPQGAKFWKNYNNKLYFYANTEVSGNSYTIRLRDSVLDEAESLQLRQSSVMGTLGIIKKLTKWVWAEAEFGYSHNINFNLSETDFKENSTLPFANTDYLIESDVSGAPYFSLSLFLALPQDFMQRMVSK